MDNWHPDDVYRLATERHNEDIARGEAARRARSATAGGPARARLATALVALAARLDPSGAVHWTRREPPAAWP